MTLEIRQQSRRSPRREGYWNWSIWVEGPDDEMNQIQEVHYLLHRTYPKPHQIVRNRGNGFRLKSAGWGEFNIAILIRLRNGEEIHRDHWLRLGASAPTKEGEPAVTKGTKVFLTYAASDSETADSAKEALREQGVVVLSPDEAEESASVEFSTAEMLDEADVVVAIVPSRPNLWLDRDIEIAEEQDKVIVPVVLGGRDISMAPDIGESLIVKNAEEIAPALRDYIDRKRVL